MEINFLKHQCVNLQPLVVGDAVAKQVDNCKLLGVYISSDLSWNEHVDFSVKKATKRIYSLKSENKRIFWGKTQLCEIKGTCGEDTQLYRYENNLTFSAILTLEMPSNEPQSFSLSFPKPVV